MPNLAIENDLLSGSMPTVFECNNYGRPLSHGRNVSRERLDSLYQNSPQVYDGELELHHDEVINPQLLPPLSEEVIISTGEADGLLL